MSRVPAPRASITLSAALLGLALLSSGCGSDPGLPVEKFEMKDVSVPAMFRELAQGLGRPYVLELPDRSIDARFDLLMEGTSEQGVLESGDQGLHAVAPAVFLRPPSTVSRSPITRNRLAPA